MLLFKNILINMKFQKNNLTEKIIINNYLKKLNFDKKGTFNFDNDAAYLNLKNKKYKFTVTSDTISENIDFFKNDNPRSIAQKITTVNLSDLYAMGATPHSYILNMCLPSYINSKWLNDFSEHLKKIQIKYNFYLLGGDLSKSDKLIISSTFFGYIDKNLEVFQNKFNIDDEILVSGNIGESKIGLEILKKNIFVNKNLSQYFINKYLYPSPCVIGSKVAKLSSSIKDISDGLIGDLNKMLNNKLGAKINLNKIPISLKTKNIINNTNIHLENLLNAGDDYCLIIIFNKKNRSKIEKIAKKNRIKISCIGKIINKRGIYFDSLININNIKEYDHFS